MKNSKYEFTVKLEGVHYDRDNNKTAKSIISKKEAETLTFYTDGYIDTEPEEHVEPDPEEPSVEPVIPVADLVKIQDVYYNNTNGEISIWISYNAAGTDTNLATLEADFLVAGYYKVKLQGTSYENEFCVCDPGMITVERTASNKIKFVLDRTGIGKDMEICFADFRNANGLVTNGMIDLSANKSADSLQINFPTNALYYKLYLRNRYGIWTHTKTTIPALAS